MIYSISCVRRLKSSTHRLNPSTLVPTTPRLSRNRIESSRVPRQAAATPSHGGETKAFGGITCRLSCIQINRRPHTSLFRLGHTSLFRLGHKSPLPTRPSIEYTENDGTRAPHMRGAPDLSRALTHMRAVPPSRIRHMQARHLVHLDCPILPSSQTKAEPFMIARSAVSTWSPPTSPRALRRRVPLSARAPPAPVAQRAHLGDRGLGAIVLENLLELFGVVLGEAGLDD